MEKIIVKGIEIKFNDLREEKQMELYKNNRKEYKEDASKSNYGLIRRIVAKNETESSELLNTMLRDEVENQRDGDVEDEIFDNKVFEIEEETIKCLAKSDFWEYREKAAALSKDSKILNQMLRKEVTSEYDNDDVVKTIFNNEVFEIEEETIICLATSNRNKYRERATLLLKDSKLLNRMLRNELENKADDLVIDRILNNENFEMEEETIEILIISDYGYQRQIAAKFLKDSEALLGMLINEIEMEYKDINVLEEIINNEAFTFDKAELLNYIYDNY